MLRIGEVRRAGRIGGTIIAFVIGADAPAPYLNVDRIWDVNVPALEIAPDSPGFRACPIRSSFSRLTYKSWSSLFLLDGAPLRAGRPPACALSSSATGIRAASWASRS